jgi:hypothetical protein
MIPLMPQGVEHIDIYWLSWMKPQVMIPLMPQGVEHPEGRGFQKGHS